MSATGGGQRGVGFDAFLSYSRRDAALVEWIARALREAEPPLTPFLDLWHLAAGQAWPELLEQRLADCRAAVIFIGPEGLGRWQQREQYVALDRQAREPRFPVIPVLLPGADDPALTFLNVNTWIDLRGRAEDPAAVAELARAIRGEPPGAPDARPDPRAEICPYRGLQPFREEDAPFFFGRDAFAERLVEATRAHAFFAVVGASGSGKSSVVRAGLIPRLRRGEDGRVWDVLKIVPGERPLAALFAAFNTPPADLGLIERDAWLGEKSALVRRDDFDLGRIVRAHLSEQPGTERLLLLVDQWEELYTQAQPREITTDEDQQRAADVRRFVDLLLQATQDDSPLTVVGTLRGDFYGHAVAHRPLADRLDGAVVNIGPPSHAELDAIVRGPAERVGLTFDEGLVPRILDAVGAEPGHLPLLEFLLTELWKRRERGQLTHDAYDEVGGVEGAIAARAELVFAGLEREAQKTAARRLFLSLVTPGEGREDTRARAPLPEDPTLQDVARRFAGPEARLLVTGEDPALGRTVEVSHEALIRHWGELHAWIDANREALRTRERIRQRMAEWHEKGEDPSLLLPPGRPLEEGRQLMAQPGDVPVDDLRPFVARSVARARRGQRRRLGAVAAAFVLLVAALGAALWQWDAATRAARSALREQERAEEVASEALMQESRALAALANAASEREDAMTGLLLALRGLPNLPARPLAGRPTHRPLNDRTLRAARNALWKISIPLAVLRGHEGWVSAAEFSPDGATVVTASDDRTARLWGSETGAERAVLRGHEGGGEGGGVQPRRYHRRYRLR